MNVKPAVRLIAIAALAPALLLLPLGVRGGLRLVAAVVIYPVAVAAGALLLFLLHFFIQRLQMSPIGQLRVVLPGATIGGPVAYVAATGLGQFSGGVSRADLESLGGAAALGLAMASIAWGLYNWGPLRLRPAFADPRAPRHETAP